MQIRNRFAIVTGATSGIGRATAIALARHGLAGIVLGGRSDRAGLHRTAELVERHGTAAVPHQGDVTDLHSLTEMYDAACKRFPRIDIVFNNAGIVSGPPAYPETALERIEQVVHTNLTAVVLSSTMAIRHMRETGGGVIVNTASTGGLNPFLADAPYAAAKASVIMYSRSCAELYSRYGIRMNAICPGITETSILQQLGGGRYPDWLNSILSGIELLQPEEIADSVIDIIRNDDIAGDCVVLPNKRVSP